MIPIRIVSCTRQKDFAGTPLGLTIQRFKHLPFIEFQLFVSNTTGLGRRYNEAIEVAKNDPAILVFVHDDVEITDWYWYWRLAAALEKHQLIGLAGNANPLPNQTSWAVVDLKGTLSNRQSWAGCVAKRDGNWDVFAPPDREVSLIDGLFMAADSRTFINNNIRFDEQFDFHHYDMDICRQFVQKGLSIYVASISVIHHSQGLISPAWEESARRYIEKWATKEKVEH